MINSSHQNRGVFLNQGWPDWDPPYYEVRANSQISADVHNETVIFDFIKWQGNGVEYESANDLQTPVVFRYDNAVAEASYKGRRISESAAATAGNNSMKIANFNYEGDSKVSFVYEEEGSLYFCEQINGTWQADQLILNNNDISPALAVLIFGEYEKIYVASEMIDPNGSNMIRLYTRTNEEWDQTVIYSQVQSDQAKPAITIAKRFNNPTITWDNGNGIFVWYSYTGQVFQIPGTNSGSHKPTICDISNSYQDKVAVAWEQYGDICFVEINLNQPSFGDIINITDEYLDMRENINPSLYSNSANGFLHLAWQAKIPYLEPMKLGRGVQLMSRVFSRTYDVSENEWWEIHLYEHEGHEGVTPVVGPEGVLWKCKGTSHLTTENGIISGINPRNPSLYGTSVLYTIGNSTPYVLKVGEFPTASKTSSIVHHTMRKELREILYESRVRSGYLSLTMEPPELSPHDSSNYLNFGDSSSTFMSSQYFTVTPEKSIVNLKTTIFAEDYQALLINNSPEKQVLRINVIDQTGVVLATPYELKVGDLYTDDDIFYDYMNKMVNLENFMGQTVCIKAEFILSGSYLTLPAHTTIHHTNFSSHKTALTVENIEEPLPIAFALHGNYPNPFNPVTDIRFDLPEDCQVDLSVYNIQGQLVARLADRKYPTGRHRVKFDGSQFSSGIYLYRLRTNKFNQVKRMLLIK